MVSWSRTSYYLYLAIMWWSSFMTHYTLYARWELEGHDVSHSIIFLHTAQGLVITGGFQQGQEKTINLNPNIFSCLCCMTVSNTVWIFVRKSVLASEFLVSPCQKRCVTSTPNYCLKLNNLKKHYQKTIWVIFNSNSAIFFSYLL